MLSINAKKNDRCPTRRCRGRLILVGGNSLFSRLIFLQCSKKPFQHDVRIANEEEAKQHKRTIRHPHR